MNENQTKALHLAKNLCIHFEGFSSAPYLCPAGYWTIGYGTVYKPDSSVVTKDHLPISKETALEWLLHELEYNYMAGVLKHSPHLIEHPQILAAITDFAYNLGVPRYRASTLSRRINENDWTNARSELQRWVRANGKIMRGLVLRRKAEAALLP
jgi:lysozyme